MKRVMMVLFCFFMTFVFVRETKGEYKGIDILLHQKIRMSDGTNLSANIFKPAEMKEPLPAIFTFTPYVADEGQQRGTFFAQNGYVYVHVDVRGRGNSQGKFLPIEKDGPDGAQVVQWLAKQPWCNGKVAMRGGSYRGMVQWQILKNFPAALKTIVPTAAPAPGIDAPKDRNIFISVFATWLAFTKGKTKNTELGSDYLYWMNKIYKTYSQYLPFSTLAEVTCSRPEIFKRWLSHPYYDDYWQNISLSDEDYKRIDIPILTITGYFDENQPGALHYFRKHMQFGKSHIKEKHYLIIGPWSHAGTRKPQKELAGMVFAENAVLNIDQLHLEWFDWILKEKEKPKFLEKRICYYVMKENKWKYQDRLKDASNQTITWYLSSEKGKANDIFHSGYLEQTLPTKKQEPDVFRYDPLKIISRDEYFKSNSSLLDQGAAFREDKLIYHSPPLKEDIEITGRVKLTAYIQLNVPDTDLRVDLYEIKPDGKSIRLAWDFMRARYRDSLSKPELVIPGTINKYVFNKSHFFARKLEKGSRLRLILSCLNHPFFEKNYNSGGVVAEETGKDARTAVIKLYHNKKYPSVLELPIHVFKANKPKK
ncbi:MAG: CocE/NonD family hydrolase [Candidatus Aminicenantes bacterium]|nr:MAG: CocE/NonD family hydrolase [Candidatus Aminicenantes bacterium]